MHSLPISVVLAHSDDSARDGFRAALEALPGVRVAGERAELRAALALARQARPHVLALELGDPAEPVLEAAAQFRLDHPETALFLIAARVDQEVLLRALRAGAQEVLRWPLDRGALATAVERVATATARRQEGRAARRVITVFSTKGGSGVSTIAVNLAVSLRRETGRDVALADFDGQTGDAAFLLGLAPRRSLADLAAAGALDEASVREALLRHPSGVHVLAQPEALEQADGLGGFQAGAVLDTLSRLFEITVVDAPHRFDEVALETFDRSSAILLVVEPTLPAVRAARRAQEILQRLSGPGGSDRLRLVLNRPHPDAAITPAALAETLGVPVFATIADDAAAIGRASDAGQSLMEKPASRAARDLTALARKLVHGGETNGAAEPVAAARNGRRWPFGRARSA